ncbi:MAG TPA: ABC transporter permease [Burkholderiales bacterium]|jgi:NitT/TauT family transport system permease protein|nr:ABC transporter permease [Burkholderiales bacterium]
MSVVAAALTRRPAKPVQWFFGNQFVRAVIALAVFVAFWELAARLNWPWIGQAPAPSAVLDAWLPLLNDKGYWYSWYQSSRRVLSGFLAAMIIGIPFGLAMATSRVFHDISFPVFEILRPIPPLAWVPAAIIFWPTQELSIGFVIFLGAIFTIMLNVIGGARSIDVRFFQAARSMGSSHWDIFRRIILPGVLPSIIVGCEVGIGITWNVVVAAEMISGGGGAIQSAAGGGLGFFIWSSYIGFSYPLIVVGMISIGIAGYISSAIIRRLGVLVTPWLRLR